MGQGKGTAIEAAAAANGKKTFTEEFNLKCKWEKKTNNPRFRYNEPM